MDKYKELIAAAQLLKTVKVDGDYWMLMQACVNSIVKIAESLKGEEDANNNKPGS